ncbi:GDSL-like Lipase/Acylhydrolase superfamily protein [Euphorbia peplus]|nr:GDSL-like Lipase/Acylhydrolase superfamily protein [Euphorbia peplus]
MDNKISTITSSSFPILLLIFASIFISTFALSSCEFPAIFSFGDSNSDTGSIEAAFVRLNPPYGDTYFQKPAGRYCDGRLIVDFIAEKLNIPHVNAYLNSMGTNFTNGANFASGGATIDLYSSILPYGASSPFNLQIQYLQFLKFKLNSQLLRKQGGVFAELMPKEESFSKALYMFDIGQNDIGVGLLTGKSIQEVNASIPNIINKLSTIVENVYKSGGRSFWILNTAPLGCLPYILINLPSEKDEAGCAKIYNQLAEYFNFKLNESIAQLRTEYPLATFVYVDIYSIKYSLFTSPQQNGFELPHVTCCGHGGTYNYSNEASCGNKIQVSGEEKLVNSCNDPSTRVVWDGIHFTEAANKFVFNQISSGAFSHPPIPLEISCRFDGEIGDPTQVSQPFGQCEIDHNLAF